MTHRAPDDAAQHVAPLLVGRHDAVGDEERHRATVLGEDAQRHVAGGTRERAVGDTGDRFGGGDERTEHVDVPHRRRVLEHRQVALEPGAGVDARRRQRHQLAVGLGVVLHEHEVPDLDVAVLVRRPDRWRDRARVPGPRRSRSWGRTGRCRPCARSCRRPGAGSAPAAGPTCSCQIFSASSSVVWTVTQSRSGSSAEDLGVELPRPLDGVFLEVVAEAEVAEHLEEREVAVGAADVVEVVVLASGAHALLDRGGAPVRRRLVTDEVGLERDHPRVREQQGVVVRDQARRRHRGVAALREEVEKGGAQLVGGAYGRVRTDTGQIVPATCDALSGCSRAGVPAHDWAWVGGAPVVRCPPDTAPSLDRAPARLLPRRGSSSWVSVDGAYRPALIARRAHRLVSLLRSSLLDL